jgi:hypothetical protein
MFLSGNSFYPDIKIIRIFSTTRKYLAAILGMRLSVAFRKENPSHEAQEVQVHQAPEDTARRGAKPQSHNATVGVQNFEPLHFCLLLENVTKNKPLLAAISSFLTGL